LDLFCFHRVCVFRFVWRCVLQLRRT
jgi:hypothetical protein